MPTSCNPPANWAPLTVLAADIGGTHSRFAVFDQEFDGRLSLQKGHWWQTPKVGGFSRLFEMLTKSELAESLSRCTRVVVAVPGPVHNGRAANLPNLSWNIESSQLQDCFPELAENQIYLINDFVAHVLGCFTQNKADMICIQHGEENHLGVVSAIGAGTGLGFCSLVLDADQNIVILPAEAGHQQFPFRGDLERSYQDFLVRETGRATVDGNTVVSGQGLALLHQFITGERLSPRGVEKRLTAESEVSRMFATFFARAAQSYALSVLPSGGFYVTGGVAARNSFLVDHDAFRTEFSTSIAHRELLSKIPIYLNVNEESGVWGAARYATMVADGRIKTAVRRAAEVAPT